MILAVAHRRARDIAFLNHVIVLARVLIHCRVGGGERDLGLQSRLRLDGLGGAGVGDGANPQNMRAGEPCDPPAFCFGYGFTP